ncbi:MAG: hypothetical protein KF894_32405, partial [Labilithrix sp.]|nr:hypothetical protein [Labilithrix sp.]
MGFRGETTNGKVDGGAGGVGIDPRVRDAADAATPKAPPTRRTLTFPTSDVLRVPSARRREDAAGARSLFTAEAPAATLLRAVGGYESSGDLGAPRESERAREGAAGDAFAERPGESAAGDALAERPSERSTVPTLTSNGVASDSSASLLELSASELESVRDLATLARAPFTAPPLPKLDLAAPRGALETSRDDRAAPSDGLEASRAITERPPPDDAPPARRRRRVAIGLAVSHALVAAVVALVAVSGRSAAQSTIAREPNVALSERTPLASPAAAAHPAPPSGGCAASGGARVLAPRAQIGPGLDVTVLETGFGVALASGTKEAVGLRVEGSGLRIAETVRVKSPSLVSHAVVESGGDDDGEGLDVRVDEGEVRSVAAAGDGPGFRIVARGGAITALLDDPRGVRARTLWALPGSFGRVALAPGASSARVPSAPGASPA